MGIIEAIAKKLEKADFYGEYSPTLTVICLIFKPGQVLAEEEEYLLIALLKEEVVPEETYVSCNRAYIEGKFKAFLHLHRFDPNKEAYRSLVKAFKLG